MTCSTGPSHGKSNAALSDPGVLGGIALPRVGEGGWSVILALRSAGSRRCDEQNDLALSAGRDSEETIMARLRRFNSCNAAAKRARFSLIRRPLWRVRQHASSADQSFCISIRRRLRVSWAGPRRRTAGHLPASQMRGSSFEEGDVAQAEPVVSPFLVQHDMHTVEH